MNTFKIGLAIIVSICLDYSVVTDADAREYMNPGNSGLIHRPSNDAELICLAKNLYFEGRGESVTGQLAIGLVTLNRVASTSFPDSICGVVTQPQQFSWYWDGKSDTPYNNDSFREAMMLAAALIHDDSIIWDVTDGALWYHADYIQAPYWTRTLHRVTKIGSHIFYKVLTA